MPLPSFFNRRREAAAQAAPPGGPMSVQALKRQAQQRLIGAAVLVGLGVVIFPWLFDTKPRPLPADVPIQIVHKDGTVSTSVASNTPLVSAPLTTGARSPQDTSAEAGAAQDTPAPKAAPTPLSGASAAAKASSAASGAAHTQSAVDKSGESDKHAAPSSATAQVAHAESSVGQKAGSPSAPAHGASATEKVKGTAPAAKTPSEQDRALALLEDRPMSAAPPAAGPAQRYVVQVGAYAENARAHEVRLKVEKTGLKTFIQNVNTPQGRRIRVRLGPYATQQEAARAAARLKQAGLQGTVMPL